jgi:predicted ATP-dependent endonuclease of OLD family
MFIEKVIIDNYRGFQHLEAELSKLTVLIGENDSGKSNFLSALALPLGISNIEYSQKRLNVSDINKKTIKAFYESIIKKESSEKKIEKIPRVSVQYSLISIQKNFMNKR